MKYVDEYRDAARARSLAAAIRAEAAPGTPYAFMEFCGGHTHAISRYGIEDLLPPAIRMIHGPGCPVCVLPVGRIDAAIALARDPRVTLCTYADLMRVPASRGSSLQKVKAEGADIRMVYSTLDALSIAAAEPGREVVFFAIGFETTAPANAMSVWQARQEGLRNYSILASHVLVPPAMEAILQSPDNRVQGFLGPGHVCTVVGYREYEPIAAKYHVPIVVTGFEPLDLLEGTLMTLRQLESGRAEVENQYPRVVKREGNLVAQELVNKVFEVCDRSWRGVGTIPQSGYRLRSEFRDYDAEQLFQVTGIKTQESPICISGLVLRGVKKPHDCPAFGKECTPQHPLGATMVSAEGACAAYYTYGRHLQRQKAAPAKQSELEAVHS
jgi:hydrogenase expression/formation protein HypD